MPASEIINDSCRQTTHRQVTPRELNKLRAHVKLSFFNQVHPLKSRQQDGDLNVITVVQYKGFNIIFYSVPEYLLCSISVVLIAMFWYLIHVSWVLKKKSKAFVRYLISITYFTVLENYYIYKINKRVKSINLYRPKPTRPKMKSIACLA